MIVDMDGGAGLHTVGGVLATIADTRGDRNL